MNNFNEIQKLIDIAQRQAFLGILEATDTYSEDIEIVIDEMLKAGISMNKIINILIAICKRLDKRS